MFVFGVSVFTFA